MTEPAALDVVIVHYGDPDLTAAALEPLAALPDAHVVVVDNAANFAAACPPFVRLVEPGRNLGFGPGVNAGAAVGDAPWLLLLNPDLEITPPDVAALVEAAARDPRLAVLAPRLTHPDGSGQINGGRFSGWTRELVRASGASRLLRPLRAAVRSDARAALADTSLIPRDWISGAAALVRRVAFEDVGGFDERFFLYYEDEDLCRRVRERGWTVAVRPDVTARHAVGGTRSGGDPYRSRAFEASRRLYHQLHSPRTLRAFVAWDSARRTAGLADGAA